MCWGRLPSSALGCGRLGWAELGWAALGSPSQVWGRLSMLGCVRLGWAGAAPVP